jgi:putative peptidoglycan lipid II flippase
LAITNIISVLSQAHRHFVIFSIAPLFYNLGIILGALFLYKEFGVYGLAYGVLIGAFMHLCIQVVTIYKIKFKFKISIDSNIIKEQFSIATPRAITLFLQQIKLIVITFFAGQFGVGALSIFTFASTLAAIPLQFFGISYSVASFPKMSELFELNNEEHFRKVAQTGLKHLTYLSLLAALFCFVFAKFIATVIYSNVNGIEQVVMCFQILTLALPFQTISWFGGRVFFSRRDTFSPLISQIISFVSIFIALYYFYINDMGLISLAYSIIIGSITELITIFILYRSRHI